ncbi:MAG TPA: YceI family protein [Tepidisphaeraceae bacterium]|nr:YceI family protein [Tepidisphaeraceae bacterium]
MRVSRVTLLSIVFFAIIVAPAAFAADYQIDPVHTSLIYRIKHMNSSYSYGRFDKPEGTFSYDPDHPDQSTFDVSVAVDNLDTGYAKRDSDLKGPDWFNAKEYPTMSFKSTSVKKDGDKLDVTGDLTIHGVTKSVTVPFDIVGTATMMGQTHTGFEGTLDIKRSDFGITAMPQVAGEDVRLIISLDGLEKK